jgi:dihydrolipoamide dehydrogenase
VSVEIGTLFAKLGTEVTILARSDVLSKFDRDAVALVKKKMSDLGIKILTGTLPVAKRDDGTVVLSNDQTATPEIIVVATGLSPYTEGLGLENTKVKLDDHGFVQVDGSLRTTDPNILAIGDVIGQPMLAHKAMRQGIVAAEVAGSKNAGYDNTVVPAVIFSDPEIALAGSVEEAEGIKIVKYPLTALGRAIALGKTDGFIKIAFDQDNLVRGVEIVSTDANALISEAALAIEMGATLEDIADTIHPHPTFGELMQEVAEAALGRPMDFVMPKQ